MAAAACAIVVVGCSCGAGTAASGGGGAEGAQPFTGWSAPGLALERRCEVADDLSSCWVVARDASGTELSGHALWTRVAREPGLDADALARRAIDVLLGEAGQEPMRPDGDRSAYASFVDDAQWAIVRAPSIEADWVVFDFFEGEMAPRAVRVRVHLPSGTIERRSLAEIASARAAAIGPPICAPALVCGCDRGCVRFEPVPPVRGTARFREIGGSGESLVFRDPRGWMQSVLDEACEESCPTPAHPPDYACAVDGDSCARSPTTAE